MGQFQIPEGLNLYHYVNVNMAEMLSALAILQTYHDDWAILPDTVKTIVKTRASSVVAAKRVFLEDLITYIGTL